jgi:hypothetical protein
VCFIFLEVSLQRNVFWFIAANVFV